MTLAKQSRPPTLPPGYVDPPRPLSNGLPAAPHPPLLLIGNQSVLISAKKGPVITSDNIEVFLLQHSSQSSLSSGAEAVAVPQSRVFHLRVLVFVGVLACLSSLA